MFLVFSKIFWVMVKFLVESFYFTSKKEGKSHIPFVATPLFHQLSFDEGFSQPALPMDHFMKAENGHADSLPCANLASYSSQGNISQQTML